MNLSDAFFENLIKGAEFLHIRPEDILVVLTGETAGKLDPAITKWARPSREPTSWADANQLLSSEGKPGALGLNTMQPGAAQTIGMTPQQWYHLPDMTPEENLVYTIKFWEAMRKSRMPNSQYANALELYLSNAAPAMLGSRLTKDTVVYNSALTKSNPALDINKDGVITVGDMAAVVSAIATGKIPRSAMASPNLDNTWYIVATPFINQYYNYLKRNNIELPNTYSPVSYDSNVADNPDYNPGSIDEQIDGINKNHSNSKYYKGKPESQTSPNWGGKLFITGIVSLIGYKLYKKMQ
jgi:hypothetical protein